MSSSCLWASFHPLTMPSFKCKDLLLNLSMKCWNPAFNAQGSRLIIVVVRLVAVKYYVAAMEARRKKERQDETQFTTKIHCFLSFIPRWMLMYFFAGFFKNLTLCMTKLRVLVLCFSCFTDNSIMYWQYKTKCASAIGGILLSYTMYPTLF